MTRVVIGVVALVLFVLPPLLVARWIGSAEERLVAMEEGPRAEVAVASAANESYCTPDLQRILRRVLQSCGLLSSTGGRGCQPLEAKQVATMSGEDFNALFKPMMGRGGIVQFEKDSSDLDAEDRALIDRVFADRGGASYFFVVARASPEGSVPHNRELSRKRAETVMDHLRQTFRDPEIEKQVGLLWLGKEFAQLEQEFCAWDRSGSDRCDGPHLNRSAFITWIDCRL